MPYRTPNNIRLRASEDLAAVLAGLQLGELQRTENQLTIDIAGGTTARVLTVAAGSMSPAAVRKLVEEGKEEGTLLVVVADRVSARLGDLLRSLGAGWLDRRGHLRLVGDGLVIDIDVPSLLPPSPGASVPVDPCATSVGREVSLELLINPAEVPSVRGLARTIRRAPSSVSAVLRALRAQVLVDDERRARTPDLFWALAASWRPQRYCLRGCPDPADPDDDWSYELHATDLGAAGWVLGDTVAASAWGIPLVASGAYPPDLYVPDQRALMRAMHRFGEVAVVNSRACTVALAPAPAVCARRFSGPGRWPLAHPVVVALDLAGDAGRGSEALANWYPEDVQRVW
jgi:hypothetical protein